MTSVVDGLAHITNVLEPRTYSAESKNSFFLDVARVEHDRDQRALERLNRHEMEAMVEGEIERRVLRGIDTATGSGGEFTVPAWLIDMFTTQARAGRVLADLVTKLPLPPGVSSVHAPKLTTSADVSDQPANSDPVQEVDGVTADAGAAGNIITVAGDADVSLQLLEQTPIGYDAVAYLDLTRAYNANLELQCLAGTGTNGQLTGVINVTGRNSDVSGSTGTTIQNLWPLLGQIAAAVGNNRKLPIEFYLMPPRRWSWIASSVDNSQRPIASPGQPAHLSDYPFAPSGAKPPAIALGAGQPMWGPGFPVYLDGAIPSTGSLEYIVALRASDMLLFESDTKFRVIFEPGSGTLQARLRLYRYAAFINTKPSSICVLTGLPTPSNF